MEMDLPQCWASTMLESSSLFLFLFLDSKHRFIHSFISSRPEMNHGTNKVMHEYPFENGWFLSLLPISNDTKALCKNTSTRFVSFSFPISFDSNCLFFFSRFALPRVSSIDWGGFAKKKTVETLDCCLHTKRIVFVFSIFFFNAPWWKRTSW